MTTLTGRKRLRQDFRGKLVLQVEETNSFIDRLFDNVEYTSWRDAKIEDLSEFENNLNGGVLWQGQ